MSRTWRGRAARALALAGAGATFGAGAFAAFELASHLRAKRTPASAIAPEAETLHPEAPESTPPLAMRDLVRRAIAATAVQGPSELDSERMKALQKELPPAAPAPRKAMPELEPTAENMSAALAAIAGSSGGERGARVRQYLRAADGLPEEEQLARTAELNALLARDRPPPPASDMDALLARIRSAPAGTLRHALVREYVEAADQLPEPEQARRLAALK